MRSVKHFRRAKVGFFSAGFLFSKLKLLPISVVAPIFHLLTQGFNFTANFLWFIGSFLDPHHSKDGKSWYGWLQLKKQFGLSALFGMSSASLYIASLWVPVLIVPAAWIGLISSLIKTIAEVHKLKNPPPDEKNFSRKKQRDFVIFSSINLALNFLTAITTTLVFTIPGIAIPITIFSALINVGLSIFAGKYWLKSNLGKPKAVQEESHKKMCDMLGPTCKLKKTSTPEIESRYKTFFLMQQLIPKNKKRPAKSNKNTPTKENPSCNPQLI